MACDPPSIENCMSRTDRDRGNLGLDVMVDMTSKLARFVSGRCAQRKRSGPPSGGSAKRVRHGKRDANDKRASQSILEKLTDFSRGDHVFVCGDETAPAGEVLQTASMSALVSVFSSTITRSNKQVPCPQLVISTVTHEAKQLVWGRDVPDCASGHDCFARTLDGAAACGPLGIYLYPEEELDFSMHGATPALRDGWETSGPRFCLLCYRLMAQTAKLAYDASIGKVSSAGMPGTILPPFTNIVDKPDGYHMGAMGVTPSDACMIGAPFICGVTSGLQVRYDRPSNTWFVEQTPDIVFTVDSNPPCL